MVARVDLVEGLASEAWDTDWAEVDWGSEGVGWVVAAADLEGAGEGAGSGWVEAGLEAAAWGLAAAVV